MSDTVSQLKEDRKSFSVIKINYENKKNIERPTWDDYFLGIAEAVSKRSHDGETQVGVVVIDENKRILATGYNGFPPGCDDKKLPNLRPDKYPFMVHAEINAIAASRQDLRNSALYCTYSPCRDCAKAIITAGIKRVVFKNAYKNEDYEFVMDFMRSCGLEVRQVK
ncbi:deoxycytidylate deaminase [Fluviispira multicolorata]|uniref:Cytidine deaminase n=1 Tax=Fluviispira multicolorata TaxID=2654512 RepID=A0A833JE44_9BACT|nr:dCMP deaminase family protein [Fluviispira multicolorata]KAB8031067.1 cytidine deaminase [Fluviispira multicolorata]